MSKTLNFYLCNKENGGFKSVEGKVRSSKQDAWSVEKIDITCGVLDLWERMGAM
jgi:hypothetical protein